MVFFFKKMISKVFLWWWFGFVFFKLWFWFFFLFCGKFNFFCWAAQGE